MMDISCANVGSTSNKYLSNFLCCKVKVWIPLPRTDYCRSQIVLEVKPRNHPLNRQLTQFIVNSFTSSVPKWPANRPFGARYQISQAAVDRNAK